MSTNSVQDPANSYSTSPPVTIILTVVFVIFFFVGFFSIYFCRYLIEYLLYSWYLRRSPAGTTVEPTGPNGGQGLDPFTIQSFPAFKYSSVQDLRKEKYGMECAICLSEFVADDLLRLLTECCHLFHQECIDLWLGSHNTCPVCRRSLDAPDPEKSPEKTLPAPTDNISAPIVVNEENERTEDSFSITIKEDNEDEEGGKIDEGAITAPTATDSGQKNEGQMRWRSHSTGHSLARSREEEDRYTLRLPEHLHVELVRGHNWTGSCTVFGEFDGKTSTGNAGNGEVSDIWGGN